MIIGKDEYAELEARAVAAEPAVAELRALLAATQAELSASDELTRHLVECPDCQQKNAGEMFWDDGDCDKFSELLNAEAETRAALSGPDARAKTGGQ